MSARVVRKILCCVIIIWLNMCARCGKFACETYDILKKVEVVVKVSFREGLVKKILAQNSVERQAL